MLITHGVHKEHMIIWRVRAHKLEAHLRKKHLLHPHNSRRHSLIKRTVLEDLNERLARMLVFETSEFPFDIPHSALKSAFEDIPRLLREFPDAKTFTVKN